LPWSVSTSPAAFTAATRVLKLPLAEATATMSAAEALNGAEARAKAARAANPRVRIIFIVQFLRVRFFVPMQPDNPLLLRDRTLLAKSKSQILVYVLSIFCLIV
jgi:hypothetical protein